MKTPRIYPKLTICVIALLLCSFSLWSSQTLRVSLTDNDLNFDPHHAYTMTEAQIMTGLYEGLLSYHPTTLEPVAGVADDWSVSEDRLTYTFRIRDNAYFSNGEKITAEHILLSWKRLLTPNENAEYSFFLDVVQGAADFRNGRITDFNRVGLSAPKEDEFIITLSQPAPHFFRMLSHHALVVVHPENFDDSAAVEQIYSGPFFVEELTDTRLIMTRNPDYWDTEIELHNIEIHFGNDLEQITELYNQGFLHWLPDGAAYDVIQDAETIVINPLFGTTYYFFNASKPLLAQNSIRRALALLLPWDEIRSSERLMIPTASLIPGFFGYERQQGILETDPKEADKLLKDAGYPNGKGLPDLKIAVSEGGDGEIVAELIKKSLEEQLDLSVEIHRVSPWTYYDYLLTGDFDMAGITWIGDYLDPLTFLDLWKGDNNLNDSGLDDENYESILAEAMGLKDQERLDKLGEAEQYLLYNAAVLPIRHSPAINVVDTYYLEGWYPNVLDIHPYKYIRFVTSRDLPGMVMAGF